MIHLDVYRLHVGCTTAADRPPADADEAAATSAAARECAELLWRVSELTDVLSHASCTVPPLCAERLSLYVAALVLPPDAAAQRITWLYSQSTRERLGFCSAALEDWLGRLEGPRRGQPRATSGVA